ncbi:MAG: beta-galactosidase [Planctomycetes bacterium]|nr:beta-galactosidase [Planctomycetota bacterium]
MPGKKAPRPEYPRPDFARSDWMNLNGTWDLDFDPDRKGVKQKWFRQHKFRKKITVPFPPESKLSGIGDTDFHRVVWYRRTFTLPKKWDKKRVLLHFGAVDYRATVWVNGSEVGTHQGGYTSFAFDLTGQLGKKNTIVLRAEDHTQGKDQPRGKQCPEPESRGCLYTRVTGIWQTVWLEAAGMNYMKSLTTVPDLSDEKVTFTIVVEHPPIEGSVKAEVRDSSRTVGSAEAPVRKGKATINVAIPGPKAWQPGRPHLYDVKLTLFDDGKSVDTVKSYFGMRTVRVENGRIYLNGRPIFLRQVLDQGYYPDGIYTAPTDAALKKDIQLAMDMGFNGARLHQKVFEPRFLYHADRMGYLCWGEMGDWGLDLTRQQARKNFRKEWIEVVERDRNHPCLITWTPFNERSGPFHTDRTQQQFVVDIVRLTKSLDPTRPVCDNSGYDHTLTDICDVHDYSMPRELEERWSDFDNGGEPSTRKQPVFVKGYGYADQPVVLSEIGGIWLDLKSKFGEGGWGYGERPKSEKEFLARYKATLHACLSKRRLSGFCYTQLYDVEQEVNGLTTYTRRAKVSKDKIKRITATKAEMER